MELSNMSSCLIKVLLSILFISISYIALAAERGACYFHVENGVNEGYYKFEWRVLLVGKSPHLAVSLHKALLRGEDFARDDHGRRIDAQEQGIPMDSRKEVKYETLINKNPHWQTKGLSWAQSTNYDFASKKHGWFFMPNNKKWHIEIPGFVSNELMECKVTYFPDTITEIPSGPAPYTGPMCTIGTNSPDYDQYKFIYNNGTMDYIAGCAAM